MESGKMENQYFNYYKGRSVKELQEVAGNPASFEDEARLTAYKLLQEKKIELSKEQIEDLKSLEDSFQKQTKVKVEVVEEELQEWYSPTAVLGFSIFFSPLIGAILLSYNLKKANKRLQANYVIVIGLVFVAMATFLMYLGKMSQIISIGISVIAGLVFIELFWKKHLGYKTEYKRKSIWKALVIVVGIVALLLAVQVAIDPELLNEIMKQQQM